MKAIAIGVLGLLTMVPAMSGCVQSTDDGGTRATRDGPDVRPDFDEETGAITGLVLSQEELPVGGADVGLLEKTNLTARTNDDGRFSLDNVPPGEYTVLAQALGYEGAQKQATVTAGAVTEVEFVLGELPSDAPFYKVDVQRVTISGIMYKATPSCIYTDVDPLIKTCGGFRLDCSGGQCEFHTQDSLEDFTDEWQTILGEVTWKPQSGVSGRGFSYDINAPNITRGSSGSINQANPYTWNVATANAPIVIRIDKDSLAERGIAESDWNNYVEDDCTAPTNNEGNNCDWFWRIFPAACDLGICNSGFGPDYGIMIDGAVEIYFSYFVKAKAPSDYTALPVS